MSNEPIAPPPASALDIADHPSPGCFTIGHTHDPGRGCGTVRLEVTVVCGRRAANALLKVLRDRERALDFWALREVARDWHQQNPITKRCGFTFQDVKPHERHPVR